MQVVYEGSASSQTPPQSSAVAPACDNLTVKQLVLGDFIQVDSAAVAVSHFVSSL